MSTHHTEREDGTFWDEQSPDQNGSEGWVESSQDWVEDPEPATLPRPSGPSWSTVALGLVCLIVAGGALAVELTDVSVAWDRAGPLTLVGLGIVLVLVGLAALLRRGDNDDN